MKNQMGKHYWKDALLFSLLGCFSFFFIAFYTDIPLRYQDNLLTLQTFIAVIISFSGVGLGMRYVNVKLREMFPTFLKNRRVVFFFFLLAAVFLFFLNYFLLVAAKILIGLPHPFTLAFRGTLLLTLIGLIELMVVSLFMVNEFYKSVIELYRHSKELEETNMQSRYMALHNQLNPHFLFNCLNTLVSEIEYNQANAVQFTRDLSDTYRYILYCQDKQFVSLNQELDFVDKFMALHRVRLGDCLFLDLRVSEELREVNVLPLTLQLLVENIVKHNVISMSRPMTITIAVQEEDSDRWLCVMNPIRLKQGVGSSGKGLDNLSLRYKLMYDKDIVIDNSNQCFTVKIPLFYE